MLKRYKKMIIAQNGYRVEKSTSKKLMFGDLIDV